MDGPNGHDSGRDEDDAGPDWSGGDDSPREDRDAGFASGGNADDRFERRGDWDDPSGVERDAAGGPGLLDVEWSPRGDGMTPTDKVRAVFVALGLGVAAFVVAFFLFQIAAILLLLGPGIEFTQLSFVGQLIAGFVILQGLSFPIVALAYLGYRGRSLEYVRARMPSLRDLAVIVGGFFLVLALVTAVLVVYSAVDAPQAERTDTQGFRENPTAILLMIPLSLMLIGPAEELLFRGVIQTRLRESFGPVGAIVFANAAFAPLHVFALSGSLAALVFTIAGLFVPGLVFGVVYEVTDNLAVPSLVHGLYNAVIFSSLYFSTTGGALLI